MIIKANAKINLTLDITGVRDDGFHTLRSVMVPVSLCDEIEISSGTDIEFDCNIKSICTSDNLCVRAAKAFFEACGTEPSVSITLNKKIPFPAGLGGGSADAAAVLKGLNKLYDFPLNNDTLFALAEKLGSDVPMCLLIKAALCEGRGEILTEIKAFPLLHIVIAIGEGRLSTPAVYKSYDAANLPVKNDTDAFLSALRENDMDKLIASCGNAFEPVTDVLCPETKCIRELMLSNGAKNAHLSGSGPSVYGIFDNEESAKTAARNIADKGYATYYCTTLN